MKYKDKTNISQELHSLWWTYDDNQRWVNKDERTWIEINFSFFLYKAREEILTKS